MPKRNTIAGQIRQLEVGQELVLPAEKYSTVNTTRYNIGFELGRKYVIERNRQQQTFSLRRIE